MRVTTTIDDNLAREAQEKAKSINESMSAFVSEAVRLRLKQLERESAREAMKELIGKGFVDDNYRQLIRDMRDA